MRNIQVKIGQKFHRLTCLQIENSTRGNSGRYALFLCDCGAKKIINIGNVVSKKSRSCGCLQSEQTSKRFTTHGDRRSRLYRIYTHMKSRCFDSNSQDYYNYGARGITVCDLWKIDYSEFKKWAECNGYKENLSIDRIDGNGNYEPKNCRWATPREQTRNLRTNVKHKGEIATDGSVRLGGNKSLITNRLNRGWSKEKAFTTPVKKGTV
jgi:hypothetical protein